MPYYNSTDLTWGSCGDFVLDTNRDDLEDTSQILGRAMHQQIDARLSSAAGDYFYMDRTASANLGRMIGKVNSPQTAQQIKDAITNALVSGNFLSAGEFNVDVAPTSKDSVIVILVVTPRGQVKSQMIAYSFDLRQRLITRRT